MHDSSIRRHAGIKTELSIIPTIYFVFFLLAMESDIVRQEETECLPLVQEECKKSRVFFL